MRPSLERHVLVLLRKELGMTQKDFADVVGCSESTLEAVERGPDRLKLSQALAEKIFLATGISTDWLLANDFTAPMIGGMKSLPYTKELYEGIQAGRSAPDLENVAGTRFGVVPTIGRLLAAFVAAEKTGEQKARLVGYRFHRFVEELEGAFGVDGFTEGAEGKAAWEKLRRAIHGFLQAANPMPQPSKEVFAKPPRRKLPKGWKTEGETFSVPARRKGRTAGGG